MAQPLSVATDGYMPFQPLSVASNGYLYSLPASVTDKLGGDDAIQLALYRDWLEMAKRRTAPEDLDAGAAEVAPIRDTVLKQIPSLPMYLPEPDGPRQLIDQTILLLTVEITRLQMVLVMQLQAMQAELNQQEEEALFALLADV